MSKKVVYLSLKQWKDRPFTQFSQGNLHLQFKKKKS